MPVSPLKTLLHQLISRVSHWFSPWPDTLKPHYLPSRYLKREVLVDVYEPITSSTSGPVHLFCFFDGQDVRTMNIPKLQQQLERRGCPTFMVVGIHANEQRMQEYGTIAQADYAKRGTKAAATAQFLIEEVLPFLRTTYTTKLIADQTYVAGFSLGGLLAFDVAWHYPQHFKVGGVFSGALWWRSKAYNKKMPDANRILHTQVEQAGQLPAVRYWFQAGTEDETSDRNDNGIIDAIDDTLQLMQLLGSKGQPDNDIFYYEMAGGRHEPQTWAQALPFFLRWAMGCAKQDKYPLVDN